MARLGILDPGRTRDGLKVEQVVFITTEDTGTDLILSFALGTSGDDIRSLILMRTPQYEPLLEESERGVTVSLEGEFDEDPMMLRVLRVLKKSVTIETDLRVYQLDLSNVDREGMKAMKDLVVKMNFDRSFLVEEA